MGSYTRSNGFAQYLTGTIRYTTEARAFIITLRSTSNGGNTAIDLQSLDDGADELVEGVMRELNPLVYYVPSAADGIIHVVTHGHNVTADSIAKRLEALSGVGTDTTVVAASSITVA